MIHMCRIEADFMHNNYYDHVAHVQAVDGVVTGDNDAFLYGARTVYCDLHANEKAITV